MRVLAPALLVPALCRLALAQPFVPPAAPPAPPLSEEARGRALYDQLCKLCHGAEAVGHAADRAPQLRNPTFLATASNTFLRQAIERGRPGTPMSAFGAAYGGPLQADGVQALITYLRSLAFVDVDKQVVGGNAAAGRGLYRQHCQGCHGESGQGLGSQSKGDTSKGGPTLRNPVFLATASDGFLRYAIEHGRPGTPMPAFQGRLSAGQIQDLTRHLRSFARPAAHEGAVGPLLPLPDPARVVQNPKGKPPRFSPLREGRYVPAAEVAEALIARAHALMPQDPFILDSLGWVRFRRGDQVGALVHLERAYGMRKDAEIAAHLGEVLWVLGQQDEARRVWREARTRDAGNDVLRATLARLPFTGLDRPYRVALDGAGNVYIGSRGVPSKVYKLVLG